MQAGLPLSAPNEKQSGRLGSYSLVPRITWLPWNSVWGWDGLHPSIPALCVELSLDLACTRGLLGNEDRFTGQQATRPISFIAQQIFSFPTVPSTEGTQWYVPLLWSLFHCIIAC